MFQACTLDITAAGFMVLAIMVTPMAYGDQSMVKEPDPEFRKLDANRDGLISHKEASKLPDFEQAFAAADENKDGKLDADEFAKAQAIHARMRAERYVEDSLITARIKVAMLKDTRVRALDVNVETDRGRVVLTGTVENKEQVRRAVEIASGVRGVVAVENNLERDANPPRRHATRQ